MAGSITTHALIPQIELGDNKLSEGLEHLHGCPLIATLSLVGNKISSIDQLKPLVSILWWVGQNFLSHHNYVVIW